MFGHAAPDEPAASRYTFSSNMSLQAAAGRAGLIIRSVVLVAMGLGIYRAVLVAWTDLVFRQSNLTAIERAERLIPTNALYHYTHALLLEQNDPASPEIEREFARAVAVNPRYSDALMAWSVQRELHGDIPGSERLLLEAQRNDRLLRPAWALANFYYRQGNTARLLTEAHECLRIIGVSELADGRFSIVPVYDLCWRSGAAADVILKQAIPDIPVILGGYLSYVMHTGRRDNAPAIVSRMLPAAEPGEMFFFRPYLEDLLAHSQVDLAARTWRQLYAKGMVPYKGPDATRGVFLTNGGIEGAPLDYGFDWRRQFPDSVQFGYSRLEHVYRFDFDGTEPENFGVIVEIVPLLPSRAYVFQASFESDLNPDPSGLRWSMHDHKTGQPLPAQTSVKVDSEATTLRLTFTTPPNVDSGDLTFSYRREPGTPRLHGYYRLLHTDLKSQ